MNISYFTKGKQLRKFSPLTTFLKNRRKKTVKISSFTSRFIFNYFIKLIQIPNNVLSDAFVRSWERRFREFDTWRRSSFATLDDLLLKRNLPNHFYFHFLRECFDCVVVKNIWMFALFTNDVGHVFNDSNNRHLQSSIHFSASLGGLQSSGLWGWNEDYAWQWHVLWERKVNIASAWWGVNN